MNAEPQKIRAVFLAAVENHDPDQWSVYLDEACGGDLELRQRVEALLTAHQQANSLLDAPAPVPGATTDRSNHERPGTVIGPYKLLQQIGEGGMGIVWMAEQSQPVQRKVALKVIKPGMDSSQVIARFEAERQALAIMDHVNIARVLDAGTTETGLPFFVMELVHGVPITKYCDDNHLTPRERLELFVPVCQAIQHAHQKGIIHRDIKPSNVMITLYDGKPVPKVIDFGVAKATEQKLTERTLFTQYGTMVGTLEYMSPEQAEMSALGVDTRSDIYSLGVLLYELLTGNTPLSHERVKKAAYAELLRIIKEEEPPKPSTRLSDSRGSLPSISAQRNMEPAKLTKLVRGELDWIVMKTLEKDRNRRYETANGLAMDVQRYLQDEPVQACPPSAWYRIRKFSRRNKAALTTAAVIALALVAGTAVSTWQAIRAETHLKGETKARMDADAALEAEKRTKLELSALKQLAEERADKIGRDLERLNAANGFVESGRFHLFFSEWAKAESEFTKAAELRSDNSSIWVERGELYTRLGLWDLAAEDFARAFQRQDPGSTQSWYIHALLRMHVEDRDGYREICKRMNERFGAPTNAALIHPLVRANLLISDPVIDRAKVLQLAERSAAGGRNAWRLTSLGTAHYRAGQDELAIKVIGESIAMNPDFEKTWNYAILAMAHHRLGRADLAGENLKAAEAEHNQRIENMFQNGVGFMPSWWWDVVESALHYREAKILIDGKPPPDDPRLWVIRGRSLAALGRQDEAAASFTKAIEMKFAAASFERASVYRKLRLWDKAIADYAQAVMVPKSAAAHNNFAWLLATCPDEKFRDAKRAVELAAKAVALEPEKGTYWNTLGVAHYRAGDSQAAVDALLKSAELRQGGDNHDWFFLAMATRRLDQKIAAGQWFTYAVTRMEHDTPADEELLRFRAEAALLLGLPDKSPLAKSPPDSAAIFTLVLETNPGAVWANERRGFALADLKRGREAAADFAKVVGAKPNDLYLRHCLAQAHLDAGNRDAYRLVCAEMLNRFGKTKDPAVASRILHACTLTPDSLPDMTQLLPLAKLAATEKGNARVLGAALVRAGKYQAAIEPLQKGQSRAWDHLFLAMAYYHMGFADEAHQYLEQASSQIKMTGYSWPEISASDHLRREAEALIKDKGDAPKGLVRCHA